ncbi:MAG: hypothetical protein ACW99Q_07840 [Candidatus Kariarchaeaceae archaeon]|jgi:hypothetical protein
MTLQTQEQTKPEQEDDPAISKLEQQYQEEREANKTKALEKLEKRYTYRELLEREQAQQEIDSLRTIVAGNYALMKNKGYGQMIECRVNDDSTFSVPIGKKEVKDYARLYEPVTVYMDMRNFWHTGGLVARIKLRWCLIWLRLFGLGTYGLLKFNMFLVDIDGEYNLPFDDLTPYELKRRVEEFLKVAHVATKAKIASNFLSDMDDTNRFNRIIMMFLITIVVIVVAFLYTMNGGF